jgi:hypothetical protein
MHRNQNSIDCLSGRNPQILSQSLILFCPGLPIFDWNFYRVVLMYIGVTSLVGVSTPSPLHPVMALSFSSCTRLSDLCTILGPPSFLEQGTIIWHLTPGSEWLNGWFLAVSAVTGSVRLTLVYKTRHTHTAFPHSHSTVMRIHVKVHFASFSDYTHTYSHDSHTNSSP